MSTFVIPKKSSMFLNFPQPISPKLHESFILKHTGETAKAEVHPKQVSAGRFGVTSAYFSVPPKILAVQAAARPLNSTVQTILKTGKIGGKLRGLGGDIVHGAKTMKNIHLKVSSVDNEKV